MKPEELVSEKLIEKVGPDWWLSEDGQSFLVHQKEKRAWIDFLGRFHFDVWYTVTFKNGCASSSLAIDRVKRLLRRACKGVGIPCDAFIVAEEHQSGEHHCHGMMRVGSLTKEMESIFLRYFWKTAFEACGRNSFSSIGDNDAVSAYVAKYLVKRPCDWLLVGCKQ